MKRQETRFSKLTKPSLLTYKWGSREGEGKTSSLSSENTTLYELLSFSVLYWRKVTFFKAFFLKAFFIGVESCEFGEPSDECEYTTLVCIRSVGHSARSQVPNACQRSTRIASRVTTTQSRAGTFPWNFFYLFIWFELMMMGKIGNRLLH